VNEHTTTETQAQHQVTTQKQHLETVFDFSSCFATVSAPAVKAPAIVTLPSLDGPDGVETANSALDAELSALLATVDATMTTDMSMYDATSPKTATESPGLLKDMDMLFDNFEAAAPAAAAAAPPAPAPALGVPAVMQQQQDAFPQLPSFDESFAADPIVAELANRLLADNTALLHAKKLVRASTAASAASKRGARAAQKQKRKPKQVVPEHMKDEAYYKKRAANTEAARRTRARDKLQKHLRAAAAAQAAAAKAQLNTLMKSR